MLLSMKWLDDYCKLNAAPREFAERMTMTGSKVETYEQEGGELSNIVVGKLLSLERHPDSDHLWVCSVDVGEDAPVQIVTGAQNLKEGDYVPAALHRSVVHGGKKITKGKLRGVESHGMLCSLDELGLTLHDFPHAVEDGIFVLNEECDLTLGLPIQQAIGLNDLVVEFEITSNRPDCMSVLGLAREASATFDAPLYLPRPTLRKGEGSAADLLQVQIDNPEGCSRYCAAVVRNIRVKPSPLWMRERLRACGVRPINNIVDITNYVMLEYGQPMHAFDLEKLEEGRIVVRSAAPQETITTLDGKACPLTSDMLVIADGKKPVAVAGVMGGEDSGITDDTTSIVFESACFDGASVRSTAKALGLRTESSSRFEKELDPSNCLPALNRALALIQELDAGDMLGEIIDCKGMEREQTRLPFEVNWINRFLGLSLSEQEMKLLLEKIDFHVENGVVTVPTNRRDVEHLADLSEEVARMYGYDKIPSTILSGKADGGYTPKQKYLRTAEQALLGLGLNEICSYSFVSPKQYDRICLPADSPLRRSVVISNPLGEDTSIMRTTAIPSMLDVLSLNYNNRSPRAALYEIATEYRPVEGELLPDELQKIVIGLYGEDWDYYTLKGIVEELLASLQVKDFDLEPVSDHPAFHPGRTARILAEGSELGLLGEIHPVVQENFHIGTRCFVAVLDVDAVYDKADFSAVYHPLPKYPAASRDLAFICDASTPVMSVQRTIAKAVGKILESIELFDVYQGKQIDADKKSIAFRIQMRSDQGTLTDQEADAATKRAIAALQEQGIELRSM